MTRVEIVPNEASLVRHCKGGNFVNGVLSGSAFQLREGEAELSVNWLDKAIGGTEDDRLRETIPMLRREVKASHWLAILCAGDIRKIAAMPRLDVLHRPRSLNPAHCGVTNVPQAKPDSPHSVSMELARAVRRCVQRADLA